MSIPLEHFHPRQPTSLNVTNILKVGILTHFKYSTLYVISLSSSFRSFQEQKLSSLTACSPIIHLSGKTLSVSSIFPLAILSFQYFFFNVHTQNWCRNHGFGILKNAFDIVELFVSVKVICTCMRAHTHTHLHLI